jgi:RimJ/RimL family protein N-acetyltransferase
MRQRQSVCPVLTSGLYQWTLTQCQFLFQYTELSAQLDWHIYEAQCKVNAVKSIAELKVLGFMQTGHTDKVLSANFSPDGKQIVSACLRLTPSRALL